MEILNKKERLSAFLLFLLMFAITTSVLVAAIFFNFRLPLKENEVLKAENEKILSEFNFQKTFADKVEYIATLVDSLDKAPESFQFTEQTINVELVNLNEKIQAKGSKENNKLYDNTIITIKELVNTKKQLLTVADSKKDLEALNSQIKAYEEENKDLLRELELSRQLSRRN
ncbi:type VI secretion system TssO [Flavobacterium sp. DG1-102-2]|uniref:type VI secretion system TssO n=1 Tax=Flavobacterium sp. DG1-102-2 TaxID=3081663 RepID=UPI0029499D18|nr:type VI secretion system TssO [Flavobacterium sp. DG1-102-2]MDV6167392.1 type VI secretion system TssO [Flavobacterium sp. DG1-102-2]